MGNEKILAEAASLQPTALLSFYIIDATPIGGGRLYLTPFVDGLASDILWQGQLYSACPIEFTGNEFRGQGTLPRPSIRFSNVMGAFTALCLSFGDLLGATITRKRTFARYLDGMPDADPSAAVPDDIFEIDRKSYQDRNYVEFELASSLEVDQVMLPRRQVMASQCPFIYRGPYCGFTANVVVATKDDANLPAPVNQIFRGEWSAGATYVLNNVVWRQLTPRVKRFFIAKDVAGNHGIQPPDPAFWNEDLCSLTLRGCGKRFGPGRPMPDPKRFGGFPGTHKIQGA